MCLNVPPEALPDPRTLWPRARRSRKDGSLSARSRGVPRGEKDLPPDERWAAERTRGEARLPAVPPPEFRLLPVPRCQRSLAPRPAPAGQAQRSLLLPAPGGVPRGPWPAPTPPFCRRKAVAAPKVGPKRRCLSPRPVSDALRLPRRLSPNRAAGVHGVRLRFLVGRGRRPSLR